MTHFTAKDALCERERRTQRRKSYAHFCLQLFSYR